MRNDLKPLLQLHVFCIFSLILGKDPRVSNAAVATSLTHGVTTHCEFYNQTQCNESRENGRSEGCMGTEKCEPASEGKRTHCYVLWSRDIEGNVNISLKGCFLNYEICYDKPQCVSKSPLKKDYMFCCCEGNMCNQNFTFEPITTEPPQFKAVEPVDEPAPSMTLIITSTVVAVAFILTVLVVAYCYRRHKHMFNELPTMEPHSNAPPSPYLGLRPIQLIEIKARGRFGAVWKAQFKSDEVAVKIFPIQDKQSWIQEQEIFKLPYMDHPNILQFIGVEKHGDNLQAEFWLISAYHERGSLCDYLKGHTLTWNEVCLIAETMARGLMHLHEPIHGKNAGDPVKSAIAHRDFKSKNVLLKNDMTACIADFGLALVFVSGKSCGDTHGQVGTRRYMAPEVLEGAINFTQDSFLRIDMYACGLVLWELVSRCTAQDAPIPEYRLPFEEEVGQHPTLEDMQESVVQRKVRPAIQENWKNHTGLSSLCYTMEECWDHDAEARLSASCVMERVMVLSRFQNNSYGLRIENDTPLSPIKESSM